MRFAQGLADDRKNQVHVALHAQVRQVDGVGGGFSVGHRHLGGRDEVNLLLTLSLQALEQGLLLEILVLHFLPDLAVEQRVREDDILDEDDRNVRMRIAENAEKLNKAPAAPLWNRALMSAYATGSTAKPSVAIAALEEGIIDEKFTVYCSGHYTYLGQEFKCEQAHESAYVNVVNAIDESCNTFFLEVGRMLGIEKMNEYRNLLGLGAKTGCELKETTGILDSPEYRSSLGQEWLPGFTVQSAIGQAGNLWTPIQLANYVNTIANGGTRYRTHFVKSIKSADYSETVMENTGEVMCRTGISEETLDIVKRGMREVGVSGYCASYFRHLPVEVAAKTGTSQEYRIINGYSTKINNGFLIAFAPYDNPEIAIAAVGEGMYSGKFVAPVIAAIVEYYCGFTDDSPEIDPAGELIP